MSKPITMTTTFTEPRTVYINEEKFNEEEEFYDVTPERRRRKNTENEDEEEEEEEEEEDVEEGEVGEEIHHSPGSSHPSGSSMRARRQGWSLASLYQRLMRTFHRAWKEVRFSDHDPDDIELNVVRYKPDGIEALARNTKFSKKELQLMYRGFKAECPNGIVSEDTFKGIYSQFFPQGDATAYAHYVFNTFDTDHQGSISFEDFVTILSELSRGSTTEKLRWAFNLYDINGDGYITKEEMLDIVSAIYSLVGRNAIPAVEENTTQEHVDRIFEKLDINGDGMVTLDEFMEICTSDETIANSLTILDTSF
ncbi:Kv channel-interacting protein 1-like isoform X2 [Portunus trituberculatus]|uniref:Kv channel-interacting protein 1-like isoform X2 n=1 Tax=Portunus trituberculatus TaxID=210409 RepID=UPI001E1CE2F6|nr:Kv channel-interacting protein 1-like isoform X2 [Portunus trituberculatus]